MAVRLQAVLAVLQHHVQGCPIKNSLSKQTEGTNFPILLFCAKLSRWYPKALFGVVEHIESEMANHGHIVGSVVLAHTGLIFIENDIERPMKCVFHWAGIQDATQLHSFLLLRMDWHDGKS